MVYLNLTYLRRCIVTLESSLTRYRHEEQGSIGQEVFRNAIVKGYELVQETAFKALKKALKAYGHGGQKLESMPIKEVLRLAAVHDLMDLDTLDRWFRYRDNRNNTAHDYGQHFAEETLILIPSFLQDVTALADEIERKCGPRSQS